jgi:hypothetical protein
VVVGADLRDLERRARRSKPRRRRWAASTSSLASGTVLDLNGASHLRLG